MFSKRTLIVLGAGASSEIGLPTGAELISRVSSELDFEKSSVRNAVVDKAIKAHAVRNGREVRPYIDAARTISRGIHFSRSIDEFIFNHGDNEEIKVCSKIAIAYVILKAERQSKIYLDKDEGIESLKTYEEIESTWYHQFVSILFSQLKKSNVQNVLKNVDVINLNYDRSIEHFLFHALRASYGLSYEDAASALQTINFIRPYGSLGQLPWQGGEGTRRYGGEWYDGEQDDEEQFDELLSPDNILSSSMKIRTFYEQAADQIVEQRIAAAVNQAQNIVFLGFGFHPQNLDLILPTGNGNVDRVFATVFGESKPSVEVIRDRLTKLIPEIRRMWTNDHVLMHGIKCGPLLSEYFRVFTS